MAYTNNITVLSDLQKKQREEQIIAWAEEKGSLIAELSIMIGRHPDIWTEFLSLTARIAELSKKAAGGAEI